MDLEAFDENSPIVANRNLVPQFGSTASPSKQSKKLLGENLGASPKQQQQQKSSAKKHATNPFPRIVELNVASTEIANLVELYVEQPVEDIECNEDQIHRDSLSFEELELASLVDTLSLERSHITDPDVEDEGSRDSEPNQDSLRDADIIPPAGLTDTSNCFAREEVANSIDQDETPVFAEAPAIDDVHSEYVKNVLNTLVVMNKKAEAVWLSKHILASFSSDFRCSEADVKANAAAISRPSVETAVVSALDEACQGGLDIVVAGATATRTMTIRALMTLVKDDPKMLSLIANVEQVFSSFASDALDDPECGRSAGWFQLELELSTREILTLEIHPALLSAQNVFSAVSPSKSARVFNVFHQLLAGAACVNGKDQELQLLDPLERQSQSVGEKFSLIRQLGAAALDDLATMLRTDYFGFNSLIDALSALGFSKEEQTTIWKSCSAVLHLYGNEQNGDARALESVSELLCIGLEELTQTLPDTANRHAFAAHLYQDVYMSIIHRINMKITSLLESKQASSMPAVTVRLFDCANSTTVASRPTSLHGGSMSAVETLRNFSDATPSVKRMDSLLKVCRQERLVIYTLGSRGMFSSPLQTSSSLALAGLLRTPWIYSTEVLNARFPSVFSAAGNDAVCEKDWETLQANQLAQSVEEMEEALSLSQQANGEYSESCLSGAVSLVEDIDKMALSIRMLLLRVREHAPLEALLARLDSLSSAAKVDRDFRILLCPVEKHLDMELALRTLRWGLENPIALGASEFLSSSFKILKELLVGHLKTAKEHVDRDVYRQVHTQEKHFARKDLPLLAGPAVINHELQDLLEHIFSFQGCSDDAFDRAKASAETLKAMKSNDVYLKGKVQAELITRFMQQTGGLHDMDRLKQEYLQQPKAKQSKERLLKSALKTLQTPLKSIASASRASTVHITPAPLRSIRAPKTSRYAPTEESTVAPLNVEGVKMRVDTICATNDFHQYFRAPFTFACGAFKQRISEVDFLVNKNQLCNAFNYIHENYYNTLVIQGPFQQRVVLEVVDACDSSTWQGQSGLLSKAGLNRLALLAFVSFAFGQYQPTVAASLVGWLQRQQVPEQAKALLTEFIFNMDPIFQSHTYGSQRPAKSFFKPEMLEDIWLRFASAVPFESEEGTVRKVGTIAEALALLAPKSEEPVSVATSITLDSSPVSKIPSSVTDPVEVGAEVQVEDEKPEGMELTVVERVPAKQLTEAEKQMWEHEERKRKHQEEWKANHVNCVILYDYADPDGEEMYLSVKAGEIVWIPLKPTGKKSALSQSKEWIWVERYVGEDPDRRRLVDEDGRPLRTEGYVPFKYVGFPGYE